MRHKSAVKRARSSRKKAERNTQWKTQMKNAIKRVRSAENQESGIAELRKTTKLLDRLSEMGVIHKNKAANNKSTLTRLVNKLPS